MVTNGERQLGSKVGREHRIRSERERRIMRKSVNRKRKREE
jgi:hypothetical protein